MELITQHVKKIMEGCKERAREAGLTFDDESLEYVVSNRDLLELSPKAMIPTLYDYWVHDVEVLREKGKYELYPHNPYETVINTRPAVSFYNDNNPDWLNVMIFYHVLGHIDFFQNNLFFSRTWEYDFNGQALADKRLISRLRTVHGRWVDYIIEFARSLDNLVDFYGHIGQDESELQRNRPKSRFDYYFDVFLQTVKPARTPDFIAEVERYNRCIESNPDKGESEFFAVVNSRHSEFESVFEKYQKQFRKPCIDLMQYVMEHSTFLQKDENKWMLQVMEVVRNTSLFFQPQIRTKILNEGWASYWHETLFLQDDRIEGHEVEFARVHAAVTSMPRVGLNPYALGLRLFQHVESQANKGRVSFDFDRLKDRTARERFDRDTGEGQPLLFHMRETLNDFLFINRYVDQDFVDDYNLFVADRKLDQERMVYQYYVRSRKAEDYKRMLFDSLYHPPRVSVDPEKSKDGELYLKHHFEGKPLVKDFVENTLIGLEYLWGGPVHLETSEVTSVVQTAFAEVPIVEWQRCLYTVKERKMNRKAA